MKHMHCLTLLALVALTGATTTGCGGTSFGSASDSGSEADSAALGGPSLSSASLSTGGKALYKTLTLQGSAGLGSKTSFTPSVPTSLRYSNITSSSKLIVGLSALPGTEGTSSIQTQPPSGSDTYSICHIMTDCIQIKVQVYDTATQAQIGNDQLISTNTSSNNGSGSCGSGVAQPSYDFSSGVQATGHGTVDVVLSSISSDVYYNSCLGGFLANHNVVPLTYYELESVELIVQSN